MLYDLFLNTINPGNLFLNTINPGNLFSKALINRNSEILVSILHLTPDYLIFN